MTDDTSPFDVHPDAELGARLRVALEGPDPQGFVARVRAAVERAGPETSWDVLARWAPAGLLAAVAAALIMWLVVRPATDPGHRTPVAASAPVQIEVSLFQPESDVLTVAVMEGR